MNAADTARVPRADTQEGGSESQWQAWLKRVTPREGWSTYVALLASLLVVVWTVNKAQWLATPSLTGIMVWSSLFGLALSRIRIHGVLLIVLSLIVGAVLVYWQSTLLADGSTFLARVTDFNQRIVLWWSAVVEGGISPDLLPFGLIIAAFTWLTGFFTAWSVFRFHNVWGAVIPTATGLVANLSYLPDSYYPFLFLYFFCAALLLVRMHTFERQQRWERRQTGYPSSHGFSTLTDAVVFAFLVFILAAMLPARPAVSNTLRTIWVEGRQPMDRMEGEFNRLFAQLPARKDVPLKQFAANMPFQGPLTNTDQTVFQVQSQFPTYWRSRVYTEYTSGGWVAEKTERHQIPWIPPVSQPMEYRSRVDLQQTITPLFPVSQLPLGSTPISAGRTVIAEVISPKTYQLRMQDASAPGAFPADVRRSFTDLKALTASMGQDQLSQTLLRVLPEGVVVSGMTLLDSQGKTESVTVKIESDDQYAAALRRSISRNQTFKLVSVQVQRKYPFPLDVVSVLSRSEVKPGEAYTVTSLVSVATAQDLTAVRGAYPGWVLDRYLQLPDTVTPRVRQLGAQITRNSVTAFEKATALENYLHNTLTYEKNIQPPPPGQDGVDHFLFVSKQGYSDYFASAFVVMARSIGLPARMVVGYAPGTYDAEGRMYIVKDSDSHGWPEAYFPGYGWIEFEPTPGKGQIPRGQPLSGDADFTSGDGGDPLGEGSESPPDSAEEPQPPPPTLQDELGRHPLRNTVVILIGMALVALVFLWLWYRQMFVQVSGAALVYDRMARLGGLAGVAPSLYETPAEYAKSLGAHLPGLQDDVHLVADVYARNRFGRRTIDAEETSRTLAAWKRIRGRLFRRFYRRR
ncbi:MAG: DUF4129 domain-containing protein [Dehalococcoidia bacterium]|nr:DUF4129 domain-containing protein [Dehalococcoidia bacterium]